MEKMKRFDLMLPENIDRKITQIAFDRSMENGTRISKADIIREAISNFFLEGGTDDEMGRKAQSTE